MNMHGGGSLSSRSEISDSVSHRSDSQVSGYSYGLSKVPPGELPPYYAELSARGLRARKKLLAPLPNLFRAAFEHAQPLESGRQRRKEEPPPPQWLQLRIKEFDAGGKHQRKRVLEQFLEYVEKKSTSGMEELFSNQAQLFFTRLTSWFAVTLPMFFELPLQLKVFLIFIEFREQTFVRSFFESGAVIPLMNTMSVDLDVPDEVRSLALVVLTRLCFNSRQYKEILCSQGLIDHVVHSIQDGLSWETLKHAARLLCELFQSNPSYQQEIFNRLQGLMLHEEPYAQRVSMQAIISLFARDPRTLPRLLGDPAVHDELMTKSVSLLGSNDVRVGADAYCLICRLLRSFGCDELLFGFARAQLQTETQNTEEWLRIEGDAHERSKEEDVPMYLGSRHKEASATMYRRTAKALAAEGAPLDAGMEDAEVVRRVRNSNEVIREAFRAEAGQILKWGLLLFLAQRNPELCTELIDGGFTETLLMCLLDVAYPVRQAAALMELHRLQMLSNKAKNLVELVLAKRELLRAMTIDDFMAAASLEELSFARYRLRNLRALVKNPSYGAQELGLRQHLLERDIEAVFLTETNAQDTGNGASAANKVQNSLAAPFAAWAQLIAVAKERKRRRSERGLFTSAADALDPIDDEPIGDAEETDAATMELDPQAIFGAELSSLVSNPLDIFADEESPLIQDLKHVEEITRIGYLHRSKVEAPSSRPAQHVERKPQTHKPSLSHQVALAWRGAPRELLAPMPLSSAPSAASSSQARPRGLSAKPEILSARTRASSQVPRSSPTPPQPLSARTPSSRRANSPAPTEDTEISLHCVDNEKLLGVWDPRMAVSAVARRFPDHGKCQQCHQHGHPYSHQHGYNKHICQRGYHQHSCKHTHNGQDLHQMSLAETSVGQELPSLVELSYDELSREMLSGSATDDLYWDKAVLTMGSEGPELFDEAEVVQASAITALVEATHRRQARKRILQVAVAPHHDCVAFDKGDQEHERARAIDSVSRHINPKTRNGFQSLQEMGSYPRRAVVGSSDLRPRSLPEHVLMGPRGAPKRTDKSTPPQEKDVRFADASSSADSCQSKVPSASGSRPSESRPSESPKSRQQLSASKVGAQASLDFEPVIARCSLPADLVNKEPMAAFFPASARQNG